MLATGTADYNVLQNNGKLAHQEVPHVHFHIIPKPSASAGLGVQWPAEKLADADATAMQAKIVAALGVAASDDDAAASAHRLPTDVVPRNYNLRLEPDLSAFTFTGSVNIECDVLADTSTVVMHAHELEVQSATCTSLNSGGGAAVQATVSLDEKSQQLTLTFPTPLQKGAVNLQIEFTGILNDKMAGFYRSTYKGADGSQKVMATTQFEATDARRAFPCWDEPDFKATFDMTVVVADPSLACLSNMPVKARTQDAATNAVTYEYFRSPVMSTYLLAFIIGELESITGRTRGGTEVNVYTTPGKVSFGRLRCRCWF